LVCDATHHGSGRQDHQRAIDLFGDDEPHAEAAVFGNGQSGLAGRHRRVRAGRHLEQLIA
jgi:hypothetical protein